ncbi:putative ribonuclease H-like domain-containing protein [Tanacetum coccineum]
MSLSSCNHNLLLAVLRYFTNSKSFRVFNSRTRIVEENLHVKFSEETPNIAGNGCNWLFDIDALTKSMNYKPVVAWNQSNGIAGTKACENAGKARVETVPGKDYILLPFLNQDPPFSSSSKDSPDARFKPSGEDEKKDVEHLENEDSEVPNIEEPRGNQEQDESVNSTNNINTVSSTVNTVGIEDNDVGKNIVYGCVDDPNMPNLEEIVYSDDDEDIDAEADMTNLDTHILVSRTPTTRVHKDHPLEQIIRDIHSAPQTRRMTKSVTDHVEPKKVIQALTNPSWLEAMQDELLQIEAIRLFLAYASFKDFAVYQMDVKSAFLYGKIEEEVYVCQPLEFEDPKFPDRVYKVEKALYGLHQALKAWYETLSTYLLDNGFPRGQIDKTLFIKRVKGDILLVQMSSMGELTFFLGLQVTQKDDGIFISQDKYVDEILKKFGFSTVKTASTPMETSKSLIKDENTEDVDVHLYRSMIGSLMYLTSSMLDIMFVVCACARFQVTPKVSHLHTVKRIFRYLKGQPKLGLWYPKDSSFDLEAYTNSDYAGASLDRKSTTGDLLTKAFDIDGWNGLEMLRMKLRLKLCCQAKVNAARLLTTARLPLESQLLRNADLDEIVVHLNANPIQYALTSSGPTTLVVDETVHKERGDTMERAGTTTASLDAEQDNDSGPRRQDTILEDRPAQTRFQRLSKQSNDPPLSGNVKIARDLEITSLKKRVKKLEKKKKARTPQLKRRLFKVKIESSTDKSLGDQEDASKQGRNEEDEDISWFQEDAETQGSTVEPSTPTTTTLIEDEDLIIASTLMKMRSEKSKEIAKEIGSKEKSSEPVTRPTRGVTMHEPSKFGTRKAVPPSQHDLKDKGKAKMIEPEKPLKKKDQIKFNEEVAKRLAEELEAELEEEEGLAQRLQEEEHGELTIEKRSRLFLELMDKRKKHFVKLRAEKIRRKSPKMKRVNSFVPIDSEVVEGSEKKIKSSRKETVSKKRAEIVLRDDEVINVESLSTKYPIVDWKTHILAEDKMYYQIIRADGSEKYYKIFSAMLDDFDRQDVLDLYRLVKERFETASPEGYDRLLWGDLITLFEPNTRITIHMLVERKYPLTQEMLSRMLSRRLEVDHECEMAYELLRFTRSQLKK